MPAGEQSHVAGFLRANDRDRYFASLLIPADRRQAVQALYAFSADVATITARVSEPGPGEIRLQWWVDALEGAGRGDVRSNPLAAALLDAMARYRLSAPPLLRLLAARRFDLYADPMPDAESFEGYAGETVSALYQLAAMILNGGAELASGDAAGHLGVAHALIGHLRAFGFHASRGRIFLPWSIFAANGVRETEVLSGTVSEGLLAALSRLHDLARDHLEKADAAVAGLPRALRPAFAMIAVLRWELKAAQADAQTPYAAPRHLADWRKIAALTWWTWRNS